MRCGNDPELAQASVRSRLKGLSFSESKCTAVVKGSANNATKLLQHLPLPDNERQE